MKKLIMAMIALLLLSFASVVTAKSRIQHREAYLEASTMFFKSVILEVAYKKFTRDYDLSSMG